MSNIHTLFLIIGRTGCGKDSLVSTLCEKNGYKQVISYSTRPRRENEGNTHIFVDDSVYEEMTNNNEIAAYTEISGFKYWSTIDQLYTNDIYIIDPIGLNVLKSLNLPNLNLVSVYINTPDDIREQRAIKFRGDNPNVFRSRNLDERRQFREFLQEAKFDYAVSNTDFAEAYSILKWICDVKKLWMNREITDAYSN